MYKTTDFELDDHHFRFKKDSYPLSKINDVQLKKLSLLDNISHLLFWLVIFSGPIWIGVGVVEPLPSWLLITAILLTLFGSGFALYRCARYALQVEFRHIDETGVQWVNVAKSYTIKDKAIFDEQVAMLKQKLAN